MRHCHAHDDVTKRDRSSSHGPLSAGTLAATVGAMILALFSISLIAADLLSDSSIGTAAEQWSEPIGAGRA